eukprot:s4157_g3.t1
MFSGMTANAVSVPQRDGADVPIPVGSPTELADDDSDMEVDALCKLETSAQAVSSHKLEKRKRDRAPPREGPGPDLMNEGEETESPTKRERSDEERPVTGSELRELLRLHVSDMKEAWHSMTSRLDKVELAQRNQTGELASLAGRTRINEREVLDLKKKQEISGTKVDALADDVKNLKVQLEEVRARPVMGLDMKGDAPHTRDPWAEYLRKHGSKQPGQSSGVAGHGYQGDRVQQDGVSAFVPSRAEGESLSEEDQKTLIVGGWMQDTRKAIIELESGPVLQREDIRPYIDQEKLAVYGPRRSVGMLKFKQRETENGIAEVKERMWKVVKKLAELKLVLDSTRDAGEAKTMWAAFMKTKSARIRTAHISMARRVTMALASGSKDEGGGVLNIDHTLPTAYDMDWNAGTIWCGIHKLASATHRVPRGAETIVMSGGWVDLDAVGLVAGCTAEAAKTAFELEL